MTIGALVAWLLTAGLAYRARELVAPEHTLDALEPRFERDTLEVTKLTDEVPFERWREQRASALPLFVVASSGAVEAFATDHPPAPRPGDAVVAPVPPTSPADASAEHRGTHASSGIKDGAPA